MSGMKKIMDNPLLSGLGAKPLNNFLNPDIPTPDTPVPPPPAPTLNNASGDLDIAAQQQARSMQRSRAATMLTGGAGLTNLGSVSSTLLGG